MTGDRKPVPYIQTEFEERQGQFSPDGKSVAYGSNESGTWQVYVQPFPATGAKWQISTAGGGQARWRRDGKELFHMGLDRKLMAVSVKTAPSFEASVPQPLLEVRAPNIPVSTYWYDVSADGKRFLINMPARETADTPITVVVNWLAQARH